MNAPDRIAHRISSMHAEMTAWRRDIHAHPELGFQETRTAAQLEAQAASRLSAGETKTLIRLLKKIYL